LCPNTDYSISLLPDFSPAGIMISDTIWVRFSDKLSAGFRHGSDSPNCFRALKYFFVNLGGHPDPGRIAFSLVDGSTSVAIQSTIVDTDGDNTTSSQTPGQPTNVLLGNSFTGVYHTWHVQIYNLGTSSTTLKIYLDGNLIQTLVGPYFPTRTGF